MSVTTLKGYDGNKKLTGRKRFIIVDVLGLVLALRLTAANVGERAGALLLFTALGQRFTRLKTILADQGFDGVHFLDTVKATYQLTVNVVCGVLGVKGFQVVPHRFLWVKQGLVHNFCHIFRPDEPLHKPDELAARAAPLLRTAFKTSIVCLPSLNFRR